MPSENAEHANFEMAHLLGAVGRISTVKYAVSLELDATKGARSILRTIHEWLVRDRKERLESESLLSNGRLRLVSGASLEVCYTDSTSPYLHAIRYAHADLTLAGRLWVTEIGIRASDGASAVQTSVVLSTVDVSTKPLPSAQSTRPRLVSRLLAANAPALSTPGLRVLTLDAQSVEPFKAKVYDPSRTAPIVVVSPTIHEGPLVDLEKLREVVHGVADVVAIEDSAEVLRVLDLVGPELIPRDGAIRMLYSTANSPYSDRVPAQTIRPIDIDDWRIAGESAARRILAMISARTARWLAGRHISMEQVKEEQVRRRVARDVSRHHSLAADVAGRQTTAQLQQLRASLSELQSDIAAFEDILTARDSEIAELKQSIDQLEYENEELKEQRSIAIAKARGLEENLKQLRDRPSDSGTGPDALRAAILALSTGGATLADCLTLIQSAFGDRVVILPTALRSARDAAGFRRVAKAYGLLHRLAGPYWEALAGGAPDTQAKQVFTANEYAAKESETVSKNRMGRTRRIFEYKGQQVEMFSHLKIGVKPSDFETLRIHFCWDAEAKVIVIGHCGGHIDFD